MKFGHWVIQHIFKKFNEIADCMTKLALYTSQNLIVFEEIPKKVLAISPVVKVSVSVAQNFFLCLIYFKVRFSLEKRIIVNFFSFT